MCEPIKNNQLLEWIQSLRINEIIVDAENMTTSEFIFILQNRDCLPLQCVHIRYPNDLDLIPVLAMLSGIDTLRELHINHACKSHLGFLPISVYRFSRLQRMSISLTVGPEEISLGTAQFFLHIRCPQLQVVSLSVCLDPVTYIVVDIKECLNHSQWLLDMIESFPSLQVLSVKLLIFNLTPQHGSENLTGE